MARRAEISRTKDHNCTRGSTGEGAAAAEWWDCAGPAAALTGFVADGDCIMVLQPGEAAFPTKMKRKRNQSYHVPRVYKS